MQQTLRKRLLADVGDLPVLPHTVVELLRLSPSDERYFDQVERLIAKDPGTTTRLLALANSAAQRGTSEVRTISEAMVRLGARGISSLVTTLGVAKAINPKKPPERGLWTHALEVAHVASVLGRKLCPREVNPEELYLAGLMHDIGRFVILVEVGDDVSPIQEGKLEDQQEALDAELAACGIDHTELGARVCEHWKMPQMVGKAAQFHHRPAAASLSGQERRLLDLVLAADSIASRACLLRGGTLGEPSDEPSLKIVSKGLPLWAAADPLALFEPVKEALDAARRANKSMGVKA